MNVSRHGSNANTLRRCFLWILLMLVCTFTFADYWAESELFHKKPSATLNLANGVGPAPAQYRIGIVMTAKHIIQLTHGRLSYRHIYAALDFVFALLAGLLIFAILRQTRAFQSASAQSRGLRTIITLGLCGYYMWWSLWYLRPETWASTLFVVATLSLLCFVRTGALVIPCMVALAILQGFIRADLAIIFNAAVFAYTLVRGQKSFLISRAAMLAASGLSCAAAAAVQWLLMHKIYPHATYGDIPVIQFFWNIHPDLFVPFLIFIVPTVFTFVRGRAGDAVGGAQGHSLLLACVLYFPIWIVVGRLEEVRIFVPFAFALIPQTANALANLLDGNGVRTQAA